MKNPIPFESRALLAGLLLSLCSLPYLPAFDLLVPAEYPTIQAAVDAALSGDTIRIAPGDYYEQVVIVDKPNLTLSGETNTVLHAMNGMTATWNQYAILTLDKSEVVVSGVSFEGDSLGEVYSGLLDGLYFYGAGGVVTNCIVSGFRGTGTSQATLGRGIHCLNPLGAGAPSVNLTIVSNTFINNQVAMILRGDPAANPQMLRVTTKVQGNTIVGFGSTPIWNVGVWIVCGVTGDVIGNTVSEFAGSGSTNYNNPGIAAYDAAAQAHTRFVPLQPLNFEANTLTNNGQHLVIMGGNDSKVVNNKFLGRNISDTLIREVLHASGTNVVVSNNDFLDSPIGILLVGNETWPPPWPPLPPAANPRLTANWFCNVPEPIRVDTNLVIGVQEQGTAQCESGPLQPVFQCIRNSEGTGAALTLRGWHGESVVIESSANLEPNLVAWVPVHTNAMSLPTFDFHDTNDVGAVQRFYRAVKP